MNKKIDDNKISEVVEGWEKKYGTTTPAFEDMSIDDESDAIDIANELDPIVLGKDVKPKEKRYRYSEIFRSIQGEGFFTGYPTIWYRTWGCNFNCSGFSAPEGVDPRTVKTEDLPQMKMDISNIKKMEDLPVFERGCDSSYSWARKFAHLAHKGTVAEISKKLRSFLPEGKFIHPESKQDYHFAITGGEPMMSQSCIVDIMKELRLDGDMPLNVTIETNGTQMLREKFVELFTNNGLFPGKLFWSCSPKLRASGEPWEKAIKPDVLWQYHLISKKGQLKYVADGTDECWDEVKRATELYREAGITWPVWIMPVGSLVEQQENIAGKIAEQAIERGYNVSARIHCYLWKNEIGR